MAGDTRRAGCNEPRGDYRYQRSYLFGGYACCRRDVVLHVEGGCGGYMPYLKAGQTQWYKRYSPFQRIA